MTFLKFYPYFPKKIAIRWVAYGGWVTCIRTQDVNIGRTVQDNPEILKKLVGYNSENFGWILDVVITDRFVTFVGAFKTARFRNSKYSNAYIQILIPDGQSGRWWI